MAVEHGGVSTLRGAARRGRLLLDVFLVPLESPVASVILYCRMCAGAYASVGDLPLMCPSCERPTRWSTMAPHSSGPPLPLTVEDRRWLRSLHVDPDA